MMFIESMDYLYICFVFTQSYTNVTVTGINVMHYKKIFYFPNSGHNMDSLALSNAK